MRWSEAELAGRDHLRVVPAEALHLTLVFLGWRERADAGRIWQAATRGAGGLAAPQLTPRAVRPVPARRPRVLALDLDDQGGHAVALQRAVALALAEDGLGEPGERPFWPHVTLARVGRGARPAWDESAPAPEPFESRRLTLYRSHLSSAGARYEALEGLALGRVPHL